MPSVPTSKKCVFLGCTGTKIFGTGFCEKHGGQRSQKYKANEKLYNSKGWKGLRTQMRSVHPLCAACLSKGIVTSTEHIDHVIPHRQNSDRFTVNLFQGLCAACHTQKTRLERQGIYRHYTAQGAIDYTDADYDRLIVKKFHADETAA